MVYNGTTAWLLSYSWGQFWLEIPDWVCLNQYIHITLVVFYPLPQFTLYLFFGEEQWKNILLHSPFTFSVFSSNLHAPWCNHCFCHISFIDTDKYLSFSLTLMLMHVHTKFWTLALLRLFVFNIAFLLLLKYCTFKNRLSVFIFQGENSNFKRDAPKCFQQVHRLGLWSPKSPPGTALTIFYHRIWIVPDRIVLSSVVCGFISCCAWTLIIFTEHFRPAGSVPILLFRSNRNVHRLRIPKNE